MSATCNTIQFYLKKKKTQRLVSGAARSRRPELEPVLCLKGNSWVLVMAAAQVVVSPFVALEMIVGK